MKKRILSVLLVLAMVMALVPMFAVAGTAATTRDTSWYEDNTEAQAYTITTAGELLGFSDLLASGTTFEGWKITLGNDIILNEGWTAGETAPTTGDTWGDTTYASGNGGTFKGTFDGNYHTISGIYLKAAKATSCTGIFGGKSDGATVKNLVLLNSYVEGESYVGAVYGECVGTTNIDNVYCDVYVKSTLSNGGQSMVGGLVGSPTGGTLTIDNSVFAGTVDVTANSRAVGGFVGRVGNATLNVYNSAFYGTVKAKNTGIGSVFGRTENANSTVLIDNCIVAGDLTNTCSDTNTAYNGSFYGQTYAVKTITITNCYYTEITLSNRAAGSVTFQPIPVAQTQATAPVAGSTYTPVKDTDLVGTLKNVSNITNFTATDGYPRPTTMIDMTKRIHDRITSWYDSTKDSFVISYSSQLLGFSDLLAAGTTFSGKTVKLGADIVLNKDWTAGATAPTDVWANVAGKTFSGTFDGQGHEISGIYLNTATAKAGIFGVVAGTASDNASVQNLAVTNSYVSNTASHTGGISGGLKYATLENLYVDIDVISTGRYTGGITTDVWNDVTISNCVYMGDVTGTQEVGGLIGWVDTSDLTIKQSAVYGNVVGTTNYNASLIGRIFNRDGAGYTVNFESCIAAGTLTSPVHGLAASFYGSAPTGGTITMTDSYCTRVVLTANKTEQTKPFPTTDGHNVLPDGVTANDFGQDAGYAENRKTNSNFRGINAITPNGFVSMPEGYTMPMGVVNMVAKMNATSTFATAFDGYQESVDTSKCDIRLIGLVNLLGEEGSTLSDEYRGFGFDVTLISATGNEWTNEVEGEIPVITTVYTSVQEHGKETPTTAAELGADYIFVATVSPIPTNVGVITLVVKTFHDDFDGNRVYDDVMVIKYDTTVAE